MSSSNFTSCSSRGDGGSIYMDNGNNDTTISNCVFNGTYSFDHHGGSIYIGSGNNNATISSCVFNGTN